MLELLREKRFFIWLLPLLMLGGRMAAAQTNPAEGLFETQWRADGACPFGPVYDFDHDRAGNVLVGDFKNNRVCKFGPDGKLIKIFEAVHAPHGLFVDREDNFYVSNYRGDTLKKFNAAGVLLKEWGGTGSGNGQFEGAVASAVNGAGQIYAADYHHHRIQKFDPQGNFLAAWGEAGSGPGQFNLPHALALDGQGNVYVADRKNLRIQIFDAGGLFLRMFAVPEGEPLGIEVDPKGLIYVAAMAPHQVLKFSAEGVLLERWGRQGQGAENQSSAPGEFSTPTNVRIDPQGRIFVSEQDNARLQIFRSGRAPERGAA